MSNKLILDVGPSDVGIDFSKWKSKRGLWGVIPKIGGYERINGVLTRFINTSYDKYYNDAKNLNLKVGAYFYSSAVSVNEAKLDAEKALEGIKGRSLDMPIYIDIEEKRQLNLSLDELTAIVDTFCETIEKNGYHAGIYSGYDYFCLMDDHVTKYSLWVAAWTHNWPKWAKNYDLWQFGGMRLSDGDIVFDDVNGYVDANTPNDIFIDKIESGWKSVSKQSSNTTVSIQSMSDTSIRDKIVNKAKSQLGVRYYSMHEGPRGSAVEGWGCAMFYAWCLNQVLGTRYEGSCYNFAGDALGQRCNQGGNQFRFISESEAKPGDAVLYIGSGYDGRDYDDYGHIAMYIGGGRVIGAMGRSKPGYSDYINIGISNTPIATQEIGGGHRFIKSIRVETLESITPIDPPVPIKVYGYNTKLHGSNNTKAQQFTFDYAGDGYLVIRSVLRNYVLDVKDGSKLDKTPVRVWEANGSTAQQWKIIPCDGEFNGQYEFEPKCAPGMRLDAINGGTINKTGLQIHPDNNTPAQRWYIIDSGDKIYRIANAKSGLCIDCGDGVQ